MPLSTTNALAVLFVPSWLTVVSSMLPPTTVTVALPIVELIEEVHEEIIPPATETEETVQTKETENE